MKSFITLFAVAIFSLTLFTAGVPAQMAEKVYSDRVTSNFAADKAEANARGRKGLQTEGDIPIPLAPSPEAVVSTNYAYTAATNGTFTSMTGSTQLVAAGSDDTSSGLTNIGFDFYFMGVRYSQFSANSNGFVRLGGAVATTQYTLGTAATALITSMGSDNIVSTSGKVHYKLTGAAPNRVLTVEFLNMTVIYDGIGSSPDCTSQVRLYENSGKIELVYGSMTRGAGTGFSAAMNAQYMGFSSGSAAGTIASIDTADALNTTTATATANQYTLSTPMANLNSPVEGSRKIFSFTPPVPVAPTVGSPANTPTTVTLNWTDNEANESQYAVYRSLDNITFNYLASTAANATTFTDTGLTPGTQYFYKVYAVSEGALSSAINFSQTTSLGGSVSCNGAGGNWSAAGTWVGGVPPTATDNAVITNGCTVTIDVPAVALTFTVQSGGILQYDAAGAQSLTVGFNGTIDAGGTFQTQNTGAIVHALSIAGNLTNNGTLDFSTSGDTAGVAITFTGSTNNTFGGTGATTDVRTITINKGTSNVNILELNPTNFTVRGVTTDTVVGGFLVLTNGTFKLSGTFTMTSRVFAAAAYTIGATQGFWLNNPNFTVAGQNGSPTETGLLRITQGTFNIGTSTGNSMGFSTGSTIIVEGGAVNAAGRFGVAAAANAITYTQTSGTITVCTIGNASATLGSFDLGTGLGSTITMSGGTIVPQLSATAIDYRNQAGGGIAGVTGGTLQLGNAASGAAKAFNIRGVVPNLVLTNTSANHTAAWSTTLVNYNNISLNITVNTGNTLNLANAVFLFNGTTLTNNGTLTHNGTSSNFVTFLATAPQTITGSGTFTVPFNAFAVQSDLGLNLTTTGQIPTLALRIFSGSVTGANKLTVGNGGATAATFQFGNTTTPTAAGVLDSAPTFNPGTAGVSISYLRTGASRVTGPEIPASRSITTMSVDENDPTHFLTLAGGDLTVTGTATLTNGVLKTNNTDSWIFNGTAARTAGWVDGNLGRTYAATGSFTYMVGQNQYSPVVANVTAAAPRQSGGKGISVETAASPSLTVRAFDARLAGFAAGQSISRNWSVESAGTITADLAFTYDVTDVNGNETDYRLYKRDSAGVATNLCPGGPCVNTGTHTVSATGISSFSRWTAAELITPTAASADISGRILTADGRPIANVRVLISGPTLPESRSSYTSQFGYYNFEDLPVGASYVVTVKARRFHFTDPSRVITLDNDLVGFDFLADPPQE